MPASLFLCASTSLRQRPLRPQLKRDPLGCRDYMTTRARRAVRLGAAAGYWAAGIGLFTTAAEFRHTILDKPWILAAGVAGSFVLWFALVGSLAYAFPPSTDELTTGMDFPGAGRIVWPVVLLLVAATIYLVIAYR